MQDIVTTATDRVSTYMEQINNLEANLYSKIEEDVAAEEKIARMKERLKSS